MKNTTLTIVILACTSLLFFTLRSNTRPHSLNTLSLSDSSAFRLSFFDVKTQTKSRMISWAVPDENLIGHFELQRSFSSTAPFNTISSVIPQANGGANYLYNDIEPGNGNNAYYRIAFVGKDGYARFSNIISAKTDRPMTMTVYPNPAVDHVSLNFPDVIKKAGIRISNSQGMPILSFQNFSGTYFNQDLLKFPDGIYYIEVISEQGTTKSSFIKKAGR